MSNYRKSSHTVYDLKVHVVWSTKYRYKVLNKEISKRIREIIRQVCDANDIQIISGWLGQDHIHLYISYPPKLSVSEIVRRLKGRSSKIIQAEFPQLGKRYWGRHFWGIGYAAFSSGLVTDEMIREYIKNHDKDQNHNDDDFVIE
jgi:putative transposase